MRKKLIEILSVPIYPREHADPAEVVADYLLDNDVLPVVLCKECKHYNEDNMSPHSGWCECLERGEYNEHFCCYGERRSGDESNI